ncbi:hypothetical protein WN944_011817 [Citrus x changshan-huyou]|uniref:Uncharacterized protein n=1 Tax=Citrus x changshan-huyou TaxID=2935761 RepID=A0AAP0QU16_9ROSI
MKKVKETSVGGDIAMEPTATKEIIFGYGAHALVTGDFRYISVATWPSEKCRKVAPLLFS